MRATILGVAGALVVSAARLLGQEPIPPQFAHLTSPQLVTRPAERMLVVEARGDPRLVGGRAFGLLFQLYYQIPETPKGPQPSAPRARWPVAFDQPREQWIGLYALPIPEAVTTLPAHTAPEGLRAVIGTWEYGPTVEVLHVGPYDQEAPTVQRLQEFAEANGYLLSAEHEEEYIRGPTMAGPGDPARYLTILRYRVTKRAG
jgi:hypothetical protein